MFSYFFLKDAKEMAHCQLLTLCMKHYKVWRRLTNFETFNEMSRLHVNVKGNYKVCAPFTLVVDEIPRIYGEQRFSYINFTKKIS